MITQSSTPRGAWSGNSHFILVIACLTPVILGLLLSAHSLSNRDIWLHNRAGRDFIGGGGIPITNRYSFTEPGHAWTDHEWLFQTCIALTDRLGPSARVTTESAAAGIETSEPRVTSWHGLRMILVALLLVLLLNEGMNLRSWRSKNLHFPPGWLGLPLLVGLHLLWPRLILRPELFSYLFFILLVREIERSTLGFGWGKSDPGPQRSDLLRPAFLLSPFTPPGRAFLLVLLWSQFHGFAALGPVIWLLAALVTPLQSHLPGLRPARRQDEGSQPRLGPADLALVLLFSLLALLLTPNGLSGLIYPLRALGQFTEPGIQLHRLISELVPLFESPQSLGGTQWFFKISLVWAGIWMILAWGRVSLLRILLWALAAWATIVAQRNIGFYALTFMMLHTGAASHPRQWWWSRRFIPNLQAPGNLLLAAITVCLACLWGFQITSDQFYLREGVSRRFGGGLTPAQFPVELVPAISAEGRARLLTNVDGAGFLIDQTRAKVFIDGRTEAYSPEIWQEYERLRAGEPDALVIIKKHETELVALSLGSGAFLNLGELLLADTDWELCALGEASLLFKPTVADAPLAGRKDILVPRLNDLETRLFSEKNRTRPVRLADRCVTMAKLWGLADQIDRQEKLLRWGLTLAPNHPVLAHNLGTLLMERDDFQTALPLFQTAAATNRRADSSLINAGVCQFRLGRLHQAADSFEQSIRINPRRLDALLNLAATLKRLDDKVGERKVLQKALALHPEHHGLKRQLELLESPSAP